MPLIIRALITGFGYKIGAELGRYFAERVGLKKPEKDSGSEFPLGMEDEDGDPDDGDDGDNNDGDGDGVAAD